MKQLKWCLVVLLGVPIAAFLMVNVATSPHVDLPPPDHTTVLALPGGGTTTLGELMEVELVSIDGKTQRPDDVPEMLRGESAEGDGGGRDRDLPRSRDHEDLIALAEFQLAAHEPQAAIALLRSIPEEHPQYSKAMRRLGWDCYTRSLGDPGTGVSYVNASVVANPFDGNAWQDASRVYLSRLGLPVR